MTELQTELKPVITNPATQCLHFDYCSYNMCPLDRGFKLLTKCEDDKEQGCRLCKSARKRIARIFGLAIERAPNFKGKIKDKQASAAILGGKAE